MKSLIFLPVYLISLQSICQSLPQGEYSFHRQEMVAGFNFSAAGKFDFYFSYGAVDRTASGTFTVEGKTIKLKSNKEPGKDFIVINQSKQKTGYTIKFQNKNKYLLDNIRCSFFVKGKREDKYTDGTGIVKAGYLHCDSIFVFHTLFPDFVTRIKDKKNDNNSFLVALNPSLAQVSFKGIDFTIENDTTISCLHNYIMPIEDIKFEKQ